MLDFDQLLTDEPPLQLTAEDIRRAGSRRVLLGRGAAVTGVAAVVAVSAVLASGLGSTPEDRVQVRSTPPQTVVVEHPAGGPRSQEVQRIVLAQSPQGWTYDLHQGISPNDDGVEGTVDDGAGKGRVYVSVTSVPGNLTRKPCEDSEFVAGATCTATPLGGGRTLIQRGLVEGKGVRTLVVGVVHDDGTGVYAESANAWWPFIDQVASGERVTAERKAELARADITRELPVYTTSQLSEVVQAVDEALLPG